MESARKAQTKVELPTPAAVTALQQTRDARPEISSWNACACYRYCENWMTELFGGENE